MDNRDHVNCNIEDTGRLMTGPGSAAGSRRLKLALVSVAAIALIAVIAGAFLIKDTRYDEQISIAEKAMMEGDYVQAEAAYAKAVDMNKREVKGREGLAYVYAVQAKYTESTEVYESLYEDTKEEKYYIAARDTENGRVPADSSLAVATPWREIKMEDVPYPDSFHWFVYNTTWEGEGKQSFEAGADNDSGSLRSIMVDLIYGQVAAIPADEFDYFANSFRNVYDMKFYETQPAFFDFDRSDASMFPGWQPDPQGWFGDSSSGAYFTFDQNKFEADLKNIYDFTDEDIRKLKQYGEDDHAFYVRDGLYYNGVGAKYPNTLVLVTSVKTDGKQYCVEYESGVLDGSDPLSGEERIDYSQPHYKYYEMIALKTINGKQYWTVSYNREEPPEQMKS